MKWSFSTEMYIQVVLSEDERRWSKKLCARQFPWTVRHGHELRLNIHSCVSAVWASLFGMAVLLSSAISFFWTLRDGENVGVIVINEALWASVPSAP